MRKASLSFSSLFCSFIFLRFLFKSWNFLKYSKSKDRDSRFLCSIKRLRLCKPDLILFRFLDHHQANSYFTRTLASFLRKILWIFTTMSSFLLMKASYVDLTRCSISSILKRSLLLVYCSLDQSSPSVLSVAAEEPSRFKPAEGFLDDNRGFGLPVLDLPLHAEVDSLQLPLEQLFGAAFAEVFGVELFDVILGYGRTPCSALAGERRCACLAVSSPSLLKITCCCSEYTL